MTTHALAVIIGTFELIGLFVLLAMPVLLTVSYVVFTARFKKSRLDLRMTEAKLLSDLAQLEKETMSQHADYVNSSETPGF